MQRIAIAVVVEGRRVLVGRRGADQTLAGSWEFPGGKVQDDESFSAAAVRECREETGLTVEVGEMLWDGDYCYDHGELHLQFYRCNPSDPTTVAREPFQWVDIDALSEYAFPAANAPVLAKLAQLFG